jgi:signal peptidase
MAEAGKKQQKTKISPEEILRGGRPVQLKPSGWSMYPMFVPGRDWALLAPVRECVSPDEKDISSLRSVRTLKCGDVALYRRRSGILVLHRICRVRPDSFWMVGDNQTEIEKNVAPEQIIALLTGFVRKGRTHGTDEIPYRVLSLVWLFLRPLRPAFHMIRAVFRPHRE